nr:MAG TPA: hypothetical protein [Caudoviricetes sp.]
MPLPRELRRITQQPLMNDIAYRAALGLQSLFPSNVHTQTHNDASLMFF